MAPRIKVSSFVESTARYAKKAAAAADLNQSGLLTSGEAKALPKDLQDDFKRQTRTGTSVSPAKFASDQAAYVAASARRADKNGDGILSATEAASLPTDLKDNLKSYQASVTTPTTTALSPAKLKQAITELGGSAVVDGGNWNSETESSSTFVSARYTGAGITDAGMLKAFGADAAGALESAGFDPAEFDANPIKANVWTSKQTAEQLGKLAVVPSGSGAMATEAAESFAKLKSLMEKNVSDLRIVTMGAGDLQPALQYVVGTVDGKAVGFRFMTHES